MPGTQSRTPIAPELVHDPAQTAIDAAKFSEVANLIPRDEVERLFRESNRREWREELRHPLEMVRSAIFGIMFFLSSCVVIVSEWVLEQKERVQKPEAYARRRAASRERETRERSPVDMILDMFTSSWVQATEMMLESHSGQPITLGDDLFPTEFPRGEFPPSSTSWRDLIASQCRQYLDDLAVAGLMGTFALRARERIAAQGRWELPLGIVVRKDGDRYLAERRAA